MAVWRMDTTLNANQCVSNIWGFSDVSWNGRMPLVVFDMKLGPPIEYIYDMFEKRNCSFPFYGDVSQFELFQQFSKNRS